MPLVEIPSFWLVFAPCGCCNGSLVGVRRDGSVLVATAEDALRRFAGNALERDRMVKLGWTVRGIEPDDDHTALLTARCPHRVKTPESQEDKR